MGVVIEICIKYPGGPLETGGLTCTYIYIYIYIYIYFSGLDPRPTPQVLYTYTYLYNHAHPHRLRLEKLLYLELSRSPNGFFKTTCGSRWSFTVMTHNRSISETVTNL
jgi:hypothetical protein